MSGKAFKNSLFSFLEHNLPPAPFQFINNQFLTLTLGTVGSLKKAFVFEELTVSSKDLSTSGRKRFASNAK